MKNLGVTHVPFSNWITTGDEAFAFLSIRRQYELKSSVYSNNLSLNIILLDMNFKDQTIFFAELIYFDKTNIYFFDIK